MSIGLGVVEVLVLAAVLVAIPCLLVTIWGIVDAAGRPDQAWAAAGENKTLWIVLQAAGLMFTGLGGAVMAVVYLAAIRPKVRAAESAGAGPVSPVG